METLKQQHNEYIAVLRKKWEDEKKEEQAGLKHSNWFLHE